MIYKRIQLDSNDENIFLDVYASDMPSCYTRKAILVIPGGAYQGIADDREGEPIALAFVARGYNAFVLHYSVKDLNSNVFPAQLIEASKAMKHIKDNAQEYKINPDKVFAVGFSAGGHLCGCLGNLWNMKEIYDAIDMPYGYNKPAGVMMIYPVVSSDYSFAHIGSIENLLGTDTPSEEMKDKVSLEKHITKESSPIFLMHTSNDQLVNVRNSLAIASACAEQGITFELHVYPDAPHGVALANEITECSMEKWSNPAIAKWVEAADMWTENI